MSVLFLDIDGVLNSIQFAIKMQGHPMYRHALDPVCVQHLQRVVDHTGCGLVISSTWRRLHSLERIGEMLGAAGLHDFAIVGATPVANEPGITRGDEVLEWLRINKYKEQYVVVDDSRDFYPRQPIVRTSSEVGLTWEDAECVIRLLQQQDVNYDMCFS